MERKEVEKKLGFSLPTVAAGAGILDNIKYAQALEIQPHELKRYFKKTIGLSTCYAGFAQNLSLEQAKGAGHAAFLSCAYDVVTDWKKPPSLQKAYVDILRAEVSPELAKMAIDLLNRDIGNTLLFDGLERGIIATKFVLQAMEIEQVLGKKCNIAELGIDMQIVDDVLDYEKDLLSGDQNCMLNADLRETYLLRLQNNLNDSTIHRLFPFGGVLIYAIKQARKKGQNMLSNQKEYF